MSRAQRRRARAGGVPPVGRAVAAALLLVGTTSVVRANGPGPGPEASASAVNPADPLAVERPLWEFGLGAGVLRLPHYRGAGQSHTWLLPVPYFIYRGEILKADRDGARAKLFESDHVEFDLSFAVGAPTRSDDNDARQGMDDLAPTVELGPKWQATFARGETWRLRAEVPVRAAFAIDGSPDFIGWVATPHLTADWRLRGGWNLGLRGGLIFGDRRYHGYFYDVAPEHARVGRPGYRAPGGYGGQQYFIALSKRFRQHWVGMYASHDSVAGARFASSPLVQRSHNLSFGIAVSWIFASSSRLVSVDE